MARWIGPDAIRATMLGNMRDAMKEDVEKLLQVRGPCVVKLVLCSCLDAAILRLLQLCGVSTTYARRVAPANIPCAGVCGLCAVVCVCVLQEIAPGRPRPERLTRKEAAKAAAAAAAAADTDAGAAGEGGAAASDGPGAAAAVDEPEQVRCRG